MSELRDLTKTLLDKKNNQNNYPTKMKKELYLVLLLFILIPSESVNAQVAELADAVALLEKASGQETLQTDEKEDAGEEEDESKTPRMKPGIVEENYG